MIVTVTDLYDGVTPESSPVTISVIEGTASAGGGGGAVDSVNGHVGVVVLDADDFADGTTNHVFTALDDTKLAGIATGATANDTDANLRARANHTGTQTLATISDAGTAAALNVPASGDATSGQAVKGSDTRLSDSRTPTAHATSHQDAGADELALDGSQITTGTVADARIASTIARDTEVTAAVSTHEGLSDPHPGYLTTAEGNAAYEASGAVATHAAAVDPHTGYLKESDYDANSILYATTDNTPVALTVAASRIVGRKATGDIVAMTAAEAATLIGLATIATSGSASDLASGNVPVARLGTGTPAAGKYVDGAAGAWTTLPAGGGALASATATGSGGGDYSGSSTTMIDVDAALSAVIAAATGDVLIATFDCSVYSNVSSFMELGLNIGGTLRRSNGVTLGGVATPLSVGVRYVVQSGDISGGNVTVKPQWKKASGTMGMINDTADRKPTVVVLNTLH